MLVLLTVQEDDQQSNILNNGRLALGSLAVLPRGPSREAIIAPLLLDKVPAQHILRPRPLSVMKQHEPSNYIPKPLSRRSSWLQYYRGLLDD